MPTDEIDLVGPMPQVLRAGFAPFGIAGPLVTVAILMTLAMRVAQASVSFTAVTRLPMVAGWDSMLPAWFSRLHTQYQTPVNSILLVGASARSACPCWAIIGVGQAEAFQLLFNASGIFYALAYVVMFAIPLFGLRGVTPRAAAVAASWRRCRALAMTLLYIALSVFPIIKVESVVDVRAQDLGRRDRGDEPGGGGDSPLQPGGKWHDLPPLRRLASPWPERRGARRFPFPAPRRLPPSWSCGCPGP